MAALDSLHLLGTHVFYGTKQSIDIKSFPVIRPYTEAPRIPMEERAVALYRHCPSLLLVKRQTGHYTPDPASVYYTMENMRFHSDGTPSYIHPALLLFFMRCFVVGSGNNAKNWNYIIKSQLYMGPRDKFDIRPCAPMAVRVKRAKTNIIRDGCQSRTCKTPSTPIHPISEYVVQQRMCRVCMGHMVAGAENWFSMCEIRRWCAEGFLNVTFNRWMSWPLQFIFAGIVCAETMELKLTTLDEFETLGRRFMECPMDVVIPAWYGMSKMHRTWLSTIGGPLFWRHATDLNSHGAWTEKHIEATQATDVYNVFGWSLCVGGSHIVEKDWFGKFIQSVDDPDNSDTVYPFRVLKIATGKRPRYGIMKSSTYETWRRLLLGARVRIRVCSVDFEPFLKDQCVVDASKPVPTTLPRNTAIHVINAHRITWGAMVRLLRTVGSRQTLTLYGSFQASFMEPPVVFADIVHTFRFLNGLSDPDIHYKVIIHEPGPELKALGFVSDHADEERVLKAPPTLCPPAALAKHPLWQTHFPFVLVMAALAMRPLSRYPIPAAVITQLVPDFVNPTKRMRLI